MNDPTAVTTILVSALISIVTAWITSRRTIMVETEKARLGSQQRAFELVLAQRLQVYPELYALLSDIPKAFDPGSKVSLVLPSVLERFNSWDSRSSLIMSTEASNCCHKFRMALVTAVQNHREPSPDDQFEDIRQLAERLELALRTDLGLHGIGLKKKLNDLEPRGKSTY